MVKENNEKNSKLSTYATIMLLTAIIVIIIAAMADDREQKFKSEIDSTTQTNMTIQEEIVKIKDENYNLTREVNSLTEENKTYKEQNELYGKLAEVWMLYSEDKPEDAAGRLAEIDSDTLGETEKEIYSAVKAAVSAEPAE